jgi:hypothetical protein
MEPVLVVLGPFTSEPFAAGLRQLLIQSGGFEVAEVEVETALGGVVQPDRPSLLLLEGDDPADCIPYLETSDNLSIVMLDPVGARAFVGLDNPNWERLVQVIAAAAGETLAHGGDRARARVQLLDPHQLANEELAERRRRSVEPVVEWLDLNLALHLQELGQQHESRGIPGWSVAPRDALELLGHGVDRSSAEDLRDRLRVVDQALIIERATLPHTIAEVATSFSLVDEELRLLCFVLAPEIDGRYATAIGVLQDDLTRRRPGLTLLAGLLGGGRQAWDLRRLLEGTGSLRRNGLIEPAIGTRDALAVDEGYALTATVVGYLLAGSATPSAESVGSDLLWPESLTLTLQEQALANRLRAILDGPTSRPIVHLVGRGRSGWFERIVAHVESRLVRGDLRRLDGARKPSAAIAEWSVLCTLHGAELMVVGLDAIEGDERHRVGALLAGLAERQTLIAIDGEPSDFGLAGTQVLRMDAPTTSVGERTQAWVEAARDAGVPLSVDQARRLGATLRLDDDADISACLELYAAEHPVGEGMEASLAGGLQRVARQLNQGTIPPAVRRIDPVYGWDDIVVSDPNMRSLRTIAAHVTYSGRVLEEWGFSRRLPYGQGVAALFSGPSGTGKTMAAQIIAGDLGLDLFEVDLSKTISKYIGETEKNLDRIFDAAETDGAVLLFNEADALFGKRTEVKDAHDRYANVEVAYLLQRMEAFMGLAILTSNLKQNIDQAFMRRLRFIVDFHLPTASERETIWRRSFPRSAPIASDLDVAFLARRLTITGGSIQQIALHAAFAAAADEAPIGMEHVVAATRRELVKIGKLNAEKSLDDIAA